MNNKKEMYEHRIKWQSIVLLGCIFDGVTNIHIFICITEHCCLSIKVMSLPTLTISFSCLEFFFSSVDRHYKNIVHGIRKCFVCMPFFLRALIGYLKFWAFSDTKNWSQFNSRIVEAFEYTIRTHVFCQLQISKKCFQKFHTKGKKW